MTNDIEKLREKLIDDLCSKYSPYLKWKEPKDEKPNTNDANTRIAKLYAVYFKDKYYFAFWEKDIKGWLLLDLGVVNEHEISFWCEIPPLPVTNKNLD